jgi:hypothetical protein
MRKTVRKTVNCAQKAIDTQRVQIFQTASIILRKTASVRIDVKMLVDIGQNQLVFRRNFSLPISMIVSGFRLFPGPA